MDKAKGDLHNAAGDVKTAARNLAKYSSGVNAIDPLPLRAGLHKAKTAAGANEIFLTGFRAGAQRFESYPNDFTRLPAFHGP